jgi:hypothetical protein
LADVEKEMNSLDRFSLAGKVVPERIALPLAATDPR